MPDSPADAALLANAAAAPPIQPAATVQTSSTDGVASAPPTRPEVVPVFRPMPPQSTYVVHVVQPGDNLLAIADRYGVDVDTLIATNALADPNVIAVGTSLRVPSTVASQLPDEQPGVESSR
ncbi:MAG TPA: LysM peptidoglycan-binding domain-containing protein [Chloroflexota bacterium]|nr:LysM peptidoglycan-binding domain-containing protein [Chloroflexota bacterium]